MLVQQNVDGSNFFNRSWEEFKDGFSDRRGNYWLGNELLYQLTSSRSYKLRFDLQATNGSWYYAEYSSFVVYSEASGYTMRVSAYSGNVADAFAWHDGMKFTTYDRDNDPWTSADNNNNCAVLNGGGFWHNSCARASVNTVRGRGNNFRWQLHGGGVSPYLQTSRMWLTC